MAAQLPETTKHTPVCYAYSRVSTLGQAEVGMSLADQKARLAGYYQHSIKPLGVIDGDLYVDAGVSAAKIPFCDRPAGRKIFDRVRPGDHILMTSLDRGFRRLRDATATIAKWTEQGIHIHFLSLGLSTNTPTGRLVLHVLAAIAEFQRDVMVESTKMGLTRRKELTGSYNGKAAMGDRIVGKGHLQRLIPDLPVRAIGRLATRLNQVEGWTMKRIAEEFRNRGVTYKQGTEWKEYQLHRLCHRCRAGQWTEPPEAVLPPLLPARVQPPEAPPEEAPAPRPQRATRGQPRINSMTAAPPTSNYSQPENFFFETPATDAIIVSSVTP